MTENRSPGGRRRWALLFWLLSGLITFVSTYFFIAKTWWLPAGVSAAGSGHRPPVYRYTYIADGRCVCAGAVSRWDCSCGSIAIRVAKSKVEYSHGNIKLEVLWTALTADPVYWAEPDGQPDLGGGAL